MVSPLQIMSKLLSHLYYVCSASLVRLFSCFYFPTKVYGLENFPKEGGCLLACNHISNLDPAIVGMIAPRPIKFIAKESLFKNPIFGTIIRMGGAVPIKRDSADLGAMKAALKFVQEGYPVIIFPQGTRGGRIPKKGIGFLAQKAKGSVVPIFIKGSDTIMPKGEKGFRRGKVEVIIGKPLEGFNSDLDYQTVANHIMDAINLLEKNF